MKESGPAPTPLRAQAAEYMRLIGPHSGLALTGAYLILTLIGFMYHVWLFAEFEINVLNFSETGDFLMAAIRQPVVIFLFVLPFGLLWLIYRVDALARRLIPAYQALYDRYRSWSSPTYKLWSGATIVLLYGTLFTQFFAENVADRIKAGRGQRVGVDLRDAAARAGAPSEALLIGTTTRFVMLYDPADSLTYIVPLETLSKLTISAKREVRTAPARSETAPPLVPQK